MQSFPAYYKSLLKKFGKLCYESWRRELFAAVAVILIVYALTFRDKTAWETTKIALKANGILLLGFAVFHLVRAPWLVQQDILKLLPKPSEKPPERIFVGKEISPSFLMGLYKEHTSVQAAKLAEVYLQKWMRVSGKINNVDSTFRNRFLVHLENYVSLEFSEVWKDKLSILGRGAEITAIGKIQSMDGLWVFLTDCEIIVET